MIVNNDFYTSTSNTLVKNNNNQNHRYLTGIHTQGNSPLDPVVPLYTEFFGPRVLSIVIISKNYGFETGTFNWPTETINTQKKVIQDAFVSWVQYKVYFYIDFVLSTRIMDATPTSKYREQMDQVKDKITALCAEMGDFGFEYKEDLEEGKDESYFQPLIDDFWRGV